MIGIIDSGLGGLTVYQAIQKRFPGAHTLYYGDTAHVPYGNKSAKIVTEYTRRCCDFLMEKGATKIVIACNTASAFALDNLSDYPVTGVIEPGARSVMAVTKGRVGVIGTRATVTSEAYIKAIDAEVYQRACPLLVPMIEEGWITGDIAEDILRIYLEPLLEKKIDTLLLGCTHYPWVRPLIQKIVGEINVIDSASAVAEEIDILPTGPSQFFVSDAPEIFQHQARILLGEEINAYHTEGALG